MDAGSLGPRLRGRAPRSLLRPELGAWLEGSGEPPLRREAPGIWSLEPFTAPALAEFALEIEAFDAWARGRGLRPRRPNGLNGSGSVLAEAGLGPLCAALVRDAFSPLAGAVLAEHGGGRLDEQHAYVVEYGVGGDRDLVQHVDDADVTLNLCLEAEGEDGGELVFEGRRCPLHLDLEARPGELHVHRHRPGVAVLHAGVHRHRVTPLRSGRRRNLVFWMRSAALREEAIFEPTCPPWCPGSRGPEASSH